MHQLDSKALRQLLREAVEALLHDGWTKRALGRRLGVGNGNLGKLLSGESRLTVDHLLAFAEVLDVPVSQLLALAFPEQEAGATRSLSDRIARRGPAERDAVLAGLPRTRAELEEVLRGALRDELDRRGLTAPPAGPNGGAPPAP
jgi:transcriptional regulator with XRE-family HTH domain